MPTPGIAVPGTTVPASSLVGSGGAQGVQGLQGPLPAQAIQFLSSAYNLTAADNAKYLVCSGGSWSLGLPAPSTTLYYRVRNDQGITGTTGTITLAPSSGFIDGAASLALLPGQECSIFSDGTNWRTFGRQRMVVLGTIDITASQANQSFLLPLGYRMFEIDFYGLYPATDRSTLWGRFSLDGGSTFLAGTSYYDAVTYPTSTTAIAYSVAQGTAQARLSGPLRNVNTQGGQTRMTLAISSDGTRPTTWVAHSEGYDTTLGCITNWTISGNLFNVSGIPNAMQILMASGNILAASIVVKGIV